MITVVSGGCLQHNLNPADTTTSLLLNTHHNRMAVAYIINSSMYTSKHSCANAFVTVHYGLVFLFFLGGSLIKY